MAEPLEFNSKGVDGEVWVEIEGEGGEEEGREEKRGQKRDADGAVKWTLEGWDSLIE